MKILVLALLLFSGCAHQTVNEKCKDPDILNRYKDYDQCYQELSQIDAGQQSDYSLLP